MTEYNNDYGTVGMSILTRRKVMEEAKYKCEWCGKNLREDIEGGRGNSAWAIHHVDRDRLRNEKYNLQLLCADCHRKMHNAMRNPHNTRAKQKLWQKKAMVPAHAR